MQNALQFIMLQGVFVESKGDLSHRLTDPAMRR